MLKFITPVLICFFLLMPFGWASSQEASLQVYPQEEHTPQRLVSLAPVITEMLIELGLEKRIVGKTSYCKIPGREKEVPDAGGYLDTSIEKVLSLKPDLVLSMKGASKTPQKLRSLGLTVEEFPNESIQDIENSFRRLGHIFGKEPLVEETLEHARKEMEAQKKEILSFLPEGSSFLVLLDEGGTFRKRFYAGAQHSFYGDMLQKLGLKNALHSDLMYAPIGMEGVLSLAPEIIFVLRETKNESVEEALEKGFKNAHIIWIYGTSPQLPGAKYYRISELFVRMLKEKIGKSAPL